MEIEGDIAAIARVGGGASSVTRAIATWRMGQCSRLVEGDVGRLENWS
ncbi:hypothetical protein [Trichocoleus desertorum]